MSAYELLEQCAGGDPADLAEACAKTAEAAFRRSEFAVAFAVARAGLSISPSDRLTKWYFLLLQNVVQARAKDARKDGPPRMLFLRTLLQELPRELTSVLQQARHGHAEKRHTHTHTHTHTHIHPPPRRPGALPHDAPPSRRLGPLVALAET